MAKLLEPLFRRLTVAIANATPGNVDAVIDRTINTFADENKDELGDAIFVPMTLAQMAGALMVADEAGKAPRRSRFKQPVGAFLGLPWEEAIDAFRERNIVSEAKFTELLRGRARDSEEARSLLLDHLRERTNELVLRALEEDFDLRDFRHAFDDLTDTIGVSRASPHYLETVYRTNTQSAYGAGRFLAMTDPDVMEARPFVQYRTVGDARVRPEHAKLHERVWRADDSGWHYVAPPNGYNCRCSMVTLSPAEARGLDIERGRPADFEPDEGFAGPPLAVAA